MFVGPTGVGKTHVAKELAKYLFDTEEALVRVDMSEYSEKHNVSRLIGSPPGYVGYGEGGQLTEKVRRRPYCVLLFDEIEKAHPDVFNLMLQIFDEGQLTDGLGRRVDFRNTIIIMTSNVGSREATQRARSVGYNTASKPAMQTLNREAAYRKNLERSFAPEFINRIDDIVTFGTLSDADVLRIVELELGLLSRRVSELGYSLDASDEAKRLLVKLGYEPAYGVRSLRRTILDRVEEPLSELIVAGTVHAGDRVTVCADGDRIELSVAPADSPTHLAS
ncbi:MAG: AAA family ATPase [Alistipes sp.]